MGLRGSLMRRKTGSELLSEQRNQSSIPLVSRNRTAENAIPIFSGMDMFSQAAAYGLSGTLYAIVRRMAESTSMVDWNLYTRPKSGKKEDREIVSLHPAIEVWNRPNPFYTRQEFVESFQQYIDLIGEASWKVEFRGGIPIELWLPHPARVFPIPHRYKFIDGYVYQSPDGERVSLDVKEIVQLKLPNPTGDPYRGMGPVQSLLYTIDSARFSEQWNRNFFVNGAEPGGLIEIPTGVGDTEYKRLKAQLAESMKGVSNAHSLLLLEAGMKWVANSRSHRDMQFAELNQISREIIREAYGFPKSMLGTADDVNRANAEAAEVVFGRWVVKTRLERIKQALNNDFLPLFGEGQHRKYEFDYDDPVPEDREASRNEMTSKAMAFKTYIDAGVDPEQVCFMLDLPSLTVTRREPAPAPQMPSPEVNNYLDLSRVEMANRWVVKAHVDDSTCDPCKDNHGKLYKNREDAYKDYPGGAGYINCIGAKYGNKCRCTVAKRRKGNDGDDD